VSVSKTALLSAVNMKLNKFKGFTLLELLIAVSLSTMLMLVLVLGLNSITRDWEKLGFKLDEKIDESLLLLQLEKAIIGTYPYRFREAGGAKQSLFFNGSESEFSWVTTVSPDRSNGLSFWHLQVNEAGGFNLSILPAYSGDLTQRLEQRQSEESDPVRYFEDYQVSLHYLVETGNQQKQWQSSWSGKHKNQFPLGVGIQFKRDSEFDQAMDFYVFGFIRATAKKTLNSIGFGGGGLENIIPRDTLNAKPAPSNPLKDLFNNSKPTPSNPLLDLFKK